MSKTILVLINGHAGVGKDTFVGFCKDYAEKEKSCKVYNVHRSDAPKRALQTLGWNGEKDEDARKLLKEMVDFMEKRGLLSQHIDNYIRFSRETNSCDLIIFYHVRDPEVIHSLMEKYINEMLKKDPLSHNPLVCPVSLLVKRDIEKPAEPNDWWGDLKKAEYTMRIQLPSKDLDTSRTMAKMFVSFLLDAEWKVVEQEEE